MMVELYGRLVSWVVSNCGGCGRYRLDVDGVVDPRHRHCDPVTAQPSLFAGDDR